MEERESESKSFVGRNIQKFNYSVSVKQHKKAQYRVEAKLYNVCGKSLFLAIESAYNKNGLNFTSHHTKKCTQCKEYVAQFS